MESRTPGSGLGKGPQIPGYPGTPGFLVEVMLLPLYREGPSGSGLDAADGALAPGYGPVRQPGANGPGEPVRLRGYFIPWGADRMAAAEASLFSLYADLNGPRPEVAPAKAAFGLTRAEAAVLALLVQGLTNKAIAERLYVSVNTVKTHMRNIYRKLGVSSRAGAVKLTVEAAGLLPPPEAVETRTSRGSSRNGGKGSPGAGELPRTELPEPKSPG